MKPIAPTYFKSFRQLAIEMLLFIFILLPFSTIAQDEGAATDEEEVSLISPSLQFISTQKNDKSIDLKANMSAKVNGNFMKLAYLKVTFYQVKDEDEKELGFSITDKAGKSIFNIKAEELTPDKEGQINLKAVFAGNKAMESVEEELSIKRALLDITPVKEDSLLSVQVKLADLSSGEEKPVVDATIGIFVKRLFRPLKIGEGTTDENGEATIEIPNNLPGNDKGDITLIARLDEDEFFGNLEASAVEKWGVPVSETIQAQPRALWSKNPPIWMLVTFIILMTVVWGHYIVIIFELFRLRKEEPKAQTNATNL